jgi:hypothetical protein
MSGAATTEGSIVGYLRLNTSDWKEKLAEADRQARELPNPDIRVNADVADALAKIEAVRAAESRLGGSNSSAGGPSGAAARVDEVAAAQRRLTVAESAAETAYARAALAAMRLEEVESKRGRTEYQVASAVLANTEALKKLDTANLRVTASEEALAVAKKRVADQALESAAAQETEAAAANESAKANGLNVTRMGLLATAAAVLIPLLAPLAGYAVGVGGAFAGMGAAGILAILGIKREMDAGTAVGNHYSAGLQTMLGYLHQLEATAAKGVLDGFDHSLATIGSAMPALNSEIGQFSNQLGTTASILVSGIITAFRVLNPLFLTAGGYVQQLAFGFQQWTSDGGLAKFAQMAITELPQVANALGALAKGGLDVIGALAPLGSTLLVTLTVLGQLLSIIAPVVGGLAPLAVAAAAVWGAFQLWGNIAPLAKSAAETVALVAMYTVEAIGPVGALAVAVGAVTLAVAGWNAVMAAQKAFSQAAALATQDYTASIIADSGAIKENTLASIAKNLHDSGAIENAHKLGISTTVLTQAILGQKDAQDKVNSATRAAVNGSKEQQDQLKKTGLNIVELGTAQQWVRQAVANTTEGVKEGVTTWKAIQEAQDAATGSTTKQTAAQTSLAAQYGMSLPALQAAQAAQKQNSDAASATTHELQMENDAAGLLTNAFTLLNGGTLNVAQAQTGAAAATNSLVDSFKQNGLAIDGNTKAAVSNQQAIQSKVQADQQSAEAIAKQTGSTEAGTKAFAASKVALEQQLAAQGLLNPAVQAYIDKLYAVPPVVETQVKMDDNAARAAAASLRAYLADMSRTWTIPVKIVTSGSIPAAGHLAAQASGGPVQPLARAAGGAIDYLAGGGSSFWKPQGTDTVPTMLTPGEFVVREPSAAYNPQFLKAYNANPQQALDSVAGSKVGKEAPTIIFHITEASNTEAVVQLVLHRLESKYV